MPEPFQHNIRRVGNGLFYDIILPGPKILGNYDSDSVAHAAAQGEKQKIQRACGPHSRKGICAHIFSHNHGIHKIIHLLKNVAHHHGEHK